MTLNSSTIIVGATKIIVKSVKSKFHFEKSYVQEETIRADKYIKVMSLRKGTLSVTTEQRGEGKIFRFMRFGEIKSIMYQDLLLIINNIPPAAYFGFLFAMLQIRARPSVL